MHVLITGGAGFIGSHLAEYHLAQGDIVHVVDDLSTGSLENIRPFLGRRDFRFDEADFLLWPDLEKAAAWANRIYHMAAIVGMHRVLAEPTKVLAVNIAGTERLLRAVRTGGWNPVIVLASSSEVYGAGVHERVAHDHFEEEADLVFHSGVLSRQNYALSKLAGEALGLSFARKCGLRVVMVRLFNTIGPRQTGRYGMVVPRFVGRAVRGEALQVYGNGRQTRSFCDVRDMVLFLDALASNPAAEGQIVNVGHDREISILELAELIRQRAGSTSPIEFVPYEVAYGQEFDDCIRRKPVLDKLRSLTGLAHSWRLEETLDDLIASVRASASMRMDVPVETR
jgi:UDP-glucose 4-epimerase